MQSIEEAEYWLSMVYKYMTSKSSIVNCCYGYVDFSCTNGYYGKRCDLARPNPPPGLPPVIDIPIWNAYTISILVVVLVLFVFTCCQCLCVCMLWGHANRSPQNGDRSSFSLPVYEPPIKTSVYQGFQYPPQ